MNCTQQALLCAILAAPEDDAPRLIYADWLDEQPIDSKCEACDGRGSDKKFMRATDWFPGKRGSSTVVETCHKCNGTGRVSNHFAERAEFIRVQCELANPPLCLFHKPPSDKFDSCLDRRNSLRDVIDSGCANCKSRAAMVGCERVLLKNHGFNWFKMPNFAAYSSKVGGSFEGWLLKESGQPGIEIPVIVRRGFVDEVRLTLAQFLQHGREIAKVHPVRTWVLTDAKPGKGSGVNRWYWFPETPTVRSLDQLTRELFDLLKSGALYNYMMLAENRRYESEQDANADLQQALYTYARPEAHCNASAAK